MPREVMVTRGAMRKSPVAAEDIHDALPRIDDRVDRKRRLNELGYPLARFMHRVPIEPRGADARCAAAGFKVERQHVCRFDRFRRRETWTQRLTTTSEPGEVVKVDPADHDYARVFAQRNVQLDLDAAFGLAEGGEVRRIVSVVIDHFQPL